MFSELHASSAFSFLDGASSPETLVERAAALDYPAIALLDRDGLYGVPRFHKAALAAGIKPIIGSEITIRSNGASPQPRVPVLWRLPVLVETQKGYRNLSRLVTRMKLAAPKGEGALTLEELDGHTAGLVALPGRPALMGHRYGDLYSSQDDAGPGRTSSRPQCRAISQISGADETALPRSASGRRDDR